MTDKEVIYNYDVFISYRHLEEDKKWAKWLLESLETWRVPKELVKKGFPTRIGRVFRDEEELPSSSDLNKSIEEALIHSKYLVVICSKNTPESVWVEREIKIFKELGRFDRIIGLLIDGEPYESFNKELTYTEENGIIKKIEPLAADVRKRNDQKEKETKQIALLKILSCILACNFDDLRQREKSREKRKLRNKLLIASSLFIVLISALLFTWDYNRVKTTYYNTFVYQYGIPKGVGKLSKSQYLKRSVTYIFEEQRRTLKSVKRVNSYGRLRDDENNFNISVWITDINTRGGVKRIVCKDHNNKIVMIREYSADLKIIELQNEFNLPFISGGNEIVRYEVSYNDNGYVTNELYYRDAWNTPISDKEGFYGRGYEVDNNGMNIVRYGINIDMKNEANRSGIFKIRFTYDHLYNVIKEEFLDKENNLIYNISLDYGYSYVEKEYDKNGNLIKLSYFDNTTNRVIPLSKLYSSISYQLDKYGNVIYENYLNNEDEYIRASYCKRNFQYDNFGNNIKVSYYDISNRKAYYTNGASSYDIKYDNNDNIIEVMYYDINDKNTSINSGYSILKTEYDNNFNQKSISYYGINTNKILNQLNYHKSIKMYDNYNRITNISYYDTKDKLINAFIYSDEYLGYDSYASHVIHYDRKGNIIKNIYLDENNNYKNLNSGYAISQYTYNNQGLVTEEKYYDNNENKAFYINSKKWFNGFHRLTRDYDEKGNVIKILFYDENDKLYMANGKFQYWVFDEGKCAGLKYEYNNSKRSKITYLGTDEKPINIAKNISTITYEDIPLEKIKDIINNKEIKCNNFRKESYYDVNNNPVLVDGYHSSYVGNNNGEKISIFTGINNELVINTNIQYGCAYLIYKYRNPFTNEDELTYYDSNNQNMLNSFGYYKRINKYDDKGFNIISREFYDTNNNPTFLANRFYKVEFDYDNFGNLVNERHYDTNNNLIIDSVDKYARSHREYDSNNRITQCVFYDLDGNLITSRFGYAKYTVDYDANGTSYTNFYDKNNILITK
ncbi:toll/interleukin-1 receptor domain-containing protein [Brachyspira intermedia]|uniref:toll/interleukin-1 receptor domain-containing protein n=1 Tax=Brachyspira intermedia TaxID=84377 RepID=UPI003006E6D8